MWSFFLEFHLLLACLIFRFVNLVNLQKMNAKTTQEFYHKLFTTCSVCQNEMSTPISVKCGHVFCSNCVAKGLKNCPICRTYISCNKEKRAVNKCIQSLIQQQTRGIRKKKQMKKTIKTSVQIQHVPVFKPTFEEFKDPQKYIISLENECAEIGCAKIIPPKEWKEMYKQVKLESLYNMKIPKLYKQQLIGKRGIYQVNSKIIDSMTVKEFIEIADMEYAKLFSTNSDLSELHRT